MADLGTAVAVKPAVLADAYDLEQQLQIARRRYVDARNTADQTRQELRELSARPGTRPEQVQAMRAKFQAVVARCNRLARTIDELEERLDV